jgi:hypothetical protein
VHAPHALHLHHEHLASDEERMSAHHVRQPVFFVSRSLCGVHTAATAAGGGAGGSGGGGGGGEAPGGADASLADRRTTSIPRWASNHPRERRACHGCAGGLETCTSAPCPPARPAIAEWRSAVVAAAASAVAVCSSTTELGPCGRSKSYVAPHATGGGAGGGGGARL